MRENIAIKKLGNGFHLCPISSKMETAPSRPSPVLRNRTGQRVRRFVFTLNNYTDLEYSHLQTFAASCTWFIMGKEVSTSETSHLQGACVMGSQKNFSSLKSVLGFRRAHIEAMKGTPEQSRIYCSKEDSNPYEFGSLPKPGKRNDVHDAVEALKTGISMQELAVEHGIAIVKFHRGLTVFRSYINPVRDVENPPKVFWLHGSTGTGKTRSVFEFATLLGATMWKSACSNLAWFDGYDGQRIAILDDFRAKGVAFNSFLQLLDRYPHTVPIKGGFVNWTPEFIIITTPHTVIRTFEQRSTFRPESIEQLERRITGTYDFDDLVEKQAFIDLSRTFVEPIAVTTANYDSDLDPDPELSLESST